jgi:hypothetical protein
MRLLALVFLLSSAQACRTKCQSNAQCSEANELCVSELSECRKSCTKPIDCTGATFCSPLASGRYACLKNEEIKRAAPPASLDDSLGNLCDPNGTRATCGDNAPICSAVFAGDPSLGDTFTCTTECTTDADCVTKAPLSCSGACAAQYENMACFPSVPVGSVEQYRGRTQNSQGQALPLYCRPRLFGYLVPKRCATDEECGNPGDRAGDTCTTDASGGGSCVSGHLGLYECCQREGECEQGATSSAPTGLACLPSSDNLAGYCTKSCTSDADCQVAGAPASASCWSTTYEQTSTAGKCKVIANPAPICRTTAKPAPTTEVVDCASPDRPAALSDNAYSEGVRRCARSF